MATWLFSVYIGSLFPNKRKIGFSEGTHTTKNGHAGFQELPGPFGNRSSSGR